MKLREQQPESWKAAHRRLYEHLCATTKEGDQPTLEALQPLYQAVAHGCQAGLQQEACDKVYFARIMRGDEYYSSKKLGALGSSLGAVACFFETTWSRTSTALNEADQSWLLNETAYYLRALGRATEALEPMRATIAFYTKNGHWKQAAQGASNLSELELTLGEVAGAVGAAEQSVTYADRSGDAFQRMSKRTTHADALHQAGRRDEAEARFREAEQMQAERQPDYPLLYSLPGFQYCDLLLAEAERQGAATFLSLSPIARSAQSISRSNVDPAALPEDGAAPPQAETATRMSPLLGRFAPILLLITLPKVARRMSAASTGSCQLARRMSAASTGSCQLARRMSPASTGSCQLARRMSAASTGSCQLARRISAASTGSCQLERRMSAASTL